MTRMGEKATRKARRRRRERGQPEVVSPGTMGQDIASDLQRMVYDKGNDGTTEIYREVRRADVGDTSNLGLLLKGGAMQR